MNFLANSDDPRRSSENAARVENVSRRGVLKGNFDDFLVIRIDEAPLVTNVHIVTRP
jgi:hypothetical protein